MFVVSVQKFKSKEIKPVNPKGNQPWILIGRPDAEAEASILWPPDVKNWLTGKKKKNHPDAGKDWGQEKGTTEFGWHHRLKGHEFEQTLGDSEGQGSLAPAIHKVAKSRTQPNNWTTTTTFLQLYWAHWYASVIFQFTLSFRIKE